MKAFVFPGQGSQFVGMGKTIYKNHYSKVKKLIDISNKILRFNLLDIMFRGSIFELNQTKFTQLAIFMHSIMLTKIIPNNSKAVAGHSLGEYSALVNNKTLSFSDALKLVYQRGMLMQEACNLTPSSMAAIIGLDNEVIEKICKEIKDVYPANYNYPGQLIISGTLNGINLACEKIKLFNPKKIFLLPVNGAFHSPFMNSAKEKLANIIEKIKFNKPIIPIYQNFSTISENNPEKIKINLIEQIIHPVRWDIIIQNMIKDGFNNFLELGPGKILKKIIKKNNSSVIVNSLS